MDESQDSPQPKVQIGDVAFGIEFIDVPDAATRWAEALDHFSAWLLSEWDREQANQDQSERRHAKA